MSSRVNIEIKRRGHRGKGTALVYLMVISMVSAVVSAILGFTGLVKASADTFQILFFIFIGVFILTVIFRFARGLDHRLDNPFDRGPHKPSS